MQAIFKGGEYLFLCHTFIFDLNRDEIIKLQDEFILPPFNDLDPLGPENFDEKTIPVIDDVDDEDDEDDDDEVRLLANCHLLLLYVCSGRPKQLLNRNTKIK